MQELVTSMLGTGGQVIVIDDGYSFMNSCLLLGGEFIEFSNENKICINPFSIMDSNKFAEDEIYREEVIQLLNVIIRNMARSEIRTNDMENSFIAEAIYHVIYKYGLKADISKVASFLKTKNDPRAQDLGFMLFPFTNEGMYGSYFNGKANLSLTRRLYDFEFEKIGSKPELRNIVLMIIMFLVTEKMFHSDRTIRTLLLIDEAWSLLHGNGSQEFVEGIARRARKYNGSIVTGTQSIDDYYKNAAATAAIQNTDWYFILAQSPNVIESMKKSGRILMTEDMESALKSVKTISGQYSEVMIYNASLGWSIGRLILDPYSVALYSSKGEEFAKIKALKAQGYTLSQALEEVANEIKR